MSSTFVTSDFLVNIQELHHFIDIYNYKVPSEKCISLLNDDWADLPNLCNLFPSMLGDWRVFLRPVYVRFLSRLARRQGATETFQNDLQFLRNINIRDIVKPDSLQAAKLLEVIDSVEDGHEMKKLRNKIKKQFRHNYHLIYPRLREISSDPLRLKMVLFRNSGRKQYACFLQCLMTVLNRKDLTDEEKRQQLCELISLQHDMYPGMHSRSAMVLPNEVHKWFWDHIARQETFDHYYFLLKNDVYLSWPHYGWKFVKRMMQGSEIELQLASLQLFLYQEDHRSFFHEKFHKVYSFHSSLLILHKVFKANDLRFAKVYLSALLRRMEAKESNEVSFIRFNNLLLYYLSQAGELDMFFQAFTVELEFIKKVCKIRTSLKILHRPLLFVLRLLRRQGHHEDFFTILSIIQMLSLGQSPAFKQHVLTELITLLRTFNDCKLTFHYVLSAFDRYATGRLLNELGLWNAGINRNATILSDEDLQLQINSLETLLPSSMTLRRQWPPMAIMTELYQLILATSAKALNADQYRVLLMDLYKNYTSALQNGLFNHHKHHDTGILSIFLHHARYELSDLRLSLTLLKDFYVSGCARNLRVTSGKCPFSIVVYKNNEISQIEINQLLILMHDAKVPLHFQFCATMVLRYLRLNNQSEARAWYQRILHARFEVEHRPLIRAIKENGWPYPAGFDKSLLAHLDEEEAEDMTQDDTFFLEEDNDSAMSSVSENHDHGASLQHVIRLLKTL